jgi:hypothetical protein
VYRPLILQNACGTRGSRRLAEMQVLEDIFLVYYSSSTYPSVRRKIFATTIEFCSASCIIQ